MRNGIRQGFTLIELAIVLVIVGLIVGGVLVGQDMVRGAEVKAQANQFNQYLTAMRAFKMKYGEYPGDMTARKANQFGFVTGDGSRGQGDGNNVWEGSNGSTPNGAYTCNGETALFWSHLSQTGLIGGNFTFAQGGNGPCADPQLLMPKAAIGRGNYVYVVSGGTCCGGGWGSDGKSYMGISVVTGFSGGGWMSTNPGLSVTEAASIDQKIDNALPQSGQIIAMYQPGCCGGAQWAGTDGTGATPASATTCYDNKGLAGTRQEYSTAQNFGNGVNCALSYVLR